MRNLLTTLILAVGVALSASAAQMGSPPAQSPLAAQTDEEKAVAKFMNAGSFGEPLRPGDHRAIPRTQHSIPPNNPSDFDLLRDAVCRADIVVMGKASEGRTLLNESQTYLFTIFDFNVERWLRPFNGDSSISVAVLGGEAILGGRTTTAAPVVPIPRAVPVALLLERIKGTRTYSLAQIMSVVSFPEGKPKVLSPTTFHFSPSDTAATFTIAMTNALASCGKK